ncbi:ABC transporter ATP-binding protein [Kibdelosporangium persicum]|uniref:Bicarbonate transport ATP-binding protein CmpC n=1 Tax=Kibdelosporangium persicum TaxID=2698649 RepID=A0ABX2F4J9_9PSEU|nr:ABC transporter ATP-binding protein [Kibdelosporangium persicum]NRN65930.1 Bicarbonate transport ATP-binding protein CmpC [Kibdelosporangium persicum]
MTGTALLDIQDVGKRFQARGRDVLALDGISLRVARGDFLCVCGASGSGKSTLLSLVAGLDTPTAGRITVDGVPVTGPGPDRGLVPQADSLYPWRTVERNVAFGLELLPVGPAERARRVDWYLAETGLSELRNSLPRQLSGGQQQRVAIARALACEPEVLLLDEPFGALDVQTKEDMQVLIRQVWQDTGTTVLMVTHDVEEAVFLGQRVVVLESGPGRVAADIAVDLPAERDLAIKRTPGFLSLRARIEDLVRAQHHTAGQATG